MNWRAGFSNRARRKLLSPSGHSVPQWIAMAARACIAKSRRLANAELRDVGEAVRPEEIRAARRDDHHDLGRKKSHRRKVEMVMVKMRDQDGIDRGEIDVYELGAAPDRTDPAAQDWIGQQAQAGGLEQDRRMAEPGEPRHLVA
jgi:hypothetical protein